MEIVKIEGLEILDSRGFPTVQAKVTLRCGAVGIASVPSGASTGKYEAHELRDGSDKRYSGKGVLRAIENIKKVITPALLGVRANDGVRADHIMIALDGVHNKSNLGANTILSVSLAIAKAAAAALEIPLYRYLGGYTQNRLPIPMMNIINGGMHASNGLDVQEFMILPVGASGFGEGVRMCAEIYHALKYELSVNGFSTSVGDEGGFAPMLKSDEAAIEIMLKAIERVGYKAPRDVMLGLDIASGGWYKGDSYIPTKSQEKMTREELIDHYKRLCTSYPILSIEDGLAEDDIAGWRMLTSELGEKHILVGDDLFVTNVNRLDQGIKQGIANTILIKPNQIGTLTETAAAVSLAKQNGYKVILSHRSGDTADTSIADMAVAFGADFIKSGAPCRSERCEKYNRLLAIEGEMFSPHYGFY
ncbi:MAG: phosphopyruvate hydratase [Clostridia bacterium]|nr:phosphopyruvate hydratase [Clostridia bacterium]